MSLLRHCVTTHSFDTNQRLVDAPITVQNPGTIQVQMTANPNLAPAGWYMVFLVNTAGVPSIAESVHLS